MIKCSIMYQLQNLIANKMLSNGRSSSMKLQNSAINVPAFTAQLCILHRLHISEEEARWKKHGKGDATRVLLEVVVWVAVSLTRRFRVKLATVRPWFRVKIKH